MNKNIKNAELWQNFMFISNSFALGSTAYGVMQPGLFLLTMTIFLGLDGLEIKLELAKGSFCYQPDPQPSFFFWCFSLLLLKHVSSGSYLFRT